MEGWREFGRLAVMFMLPWFLLMSSIALFLKWWAPIWFKAAREQCERTHASRVSKNWKTEGAIEEVWELKFPTGKTIHVKSEERRWK